MIIFFSTSCGAAEERLLQIIETMVSEKDIRIYRTIGSFSRGLRQPQNDTDIAILLVSSKVELNHLNLISLWNLLSDMKTIVILPDSNPDTVAKGHILRPRFLSYCDGDFQDVAAVLSRMIENSETDEKRIVKSKPKHRENARRTVSDMPRHG
ncbi:MAG: hypothetical protein ABSE05_07750 [Syntrophales bacterium]|jgi:predicted nucleotidyltransferase